MKTLIDPRKQLAMRQRLADELKVPESALDSLGMVSVTDGTEEFDVNVAGCLDEIDKKCSVPVLDREVYAEMVAVLRSVSEVSVSRDVRHGAGWVAAYEKTPLAQKAAKILFQLGEL